MCPVCLSPGMRETHRPSFFCSQNSYLVLAGLDDGLVAVFPVVRGAPDNSCSYLCSHTANRSKFNIPDEDTRQNPYPVKAMEVVNSGSEVWYSNGPGLLVIDCAALEISRRLEPYSAPSVVTSVVCSSECRGEEVVWCLDDRANSLVMYHAATYQLCARYFCGDPSPLRDMFPVRPLGPQSPDSHAAGPKEPEGDGIADVSIMYSEELGTQILTHQDSLTDYCSMSSYSSNSPHRAPASSSSLPCSPASSSSVPFSTDCDDSDRLHEPAAGSDRSEHDMTPVDGEAFSQHLQAVRILAVKDVIWVPRYVSREWGVLLCCPWELAGGAAIRLFWSPKGSLWQTQEGCTSAPLPPGDPKADRPPRLISRDLVSCWERPSGLGFGALPVTQSILAEAARLWPCLRAHRLHLPHGQPSPGPNASPSRFWFPRRGGDVIVIGLEKDTGGQRGRVIAVLKARELTPHG